MEKDEYTKKLKNVEIENGAITILQSVPKGDFILPNGKCITELPAFLRIVVNLKPAPNSNINIEVWLPEDTWNGRLLGTGNGGGAGQIVYWSLAEGIKQGYATVNTDMGTSPNANNAAGIPERYKDFGYRATHLMTVVAKLFIQEYYQKPADFSYFVGDSTGGQQALMEAQRYPSDYNGIIAGVPANNRTLLHTALLWNHKALNQEPGSSLSSEELERITKEVISRRTDKNGGAPEDSFLTDPRSCGFELENILKDLKLCEAQIAALKKIYSGPVNPRTGEQIYTPIPFGSENSPAGLRYQEDPKHFPDDLFYVFRWAFGDNFDYNKFDFDHDLDTLNEKLAPILNANDPDLTEIKKLGGKIIMYSGTADPIVPYQDALNYYERVIEVQQGIEQTQDFFRYYMVPGRGHGEDGCAGFSNLGLQKPHPVLSALVEWVEQGKAPEEMIANAFEGGCPSNKIIAQRPVYPYPEFAEYRGGNPNKPAGFKAVEHPRGNVLKPASRYLVP